MGSMCNELGCTYHIDRLDGLESIFTRLALLQPLCLGLEPYAEDLSILGTTKDNEENERNLL